MSQFLDGWTSKLWSRFFCLSVYVTMYLNDHQRSAFYESLGLNTTQFNRCPPLFFLFAPPCAFAAPALFAVSHALQRCLDKTTAEPASLLNWY